MDVLGPLLDLDPAPNPDLVDQVLQMFGELIGVAARSAREKATPADIERARRIVGDMLSCKEVGEREHGELRDLAELFIEVAGHLVLRLMINGLITTFWARMHASGIKPRLDGDAYRDIARSLDAALEQRDASGVGEAMQRMNSVIRDSVRDALKADRRKQRKSA
jgi:DNA-binding GntR family transcriptional regulator